jgi:hypothetical protein
MATIFRNFWGKKKKKPEPLSKEDQERAGDILLRLRNLKLEAESEKITLKGTLEEKQALIVKAIHENRVQDGLHEMVGLRNEFDSTVTDKKNWEKKKTDYDDTKSKVDILKDWEVPKTDVLVKSLEAIDKHVVGEDFHGATQLLGALHPKVVSTHTDATNKRAAQVQFNNAYKTRYLDKIAHPDYLPSPDPGPANLKNERDGIDVDVDAVIDHRDKTEYGIAEGLLPALETRIDNYIRDRKDYLTKRDKFVNDEGPLTDRIKAIVEMDDDIPDDKRVLKQEVVDINGQMETDKTNFDYGAAQVKLDDLKNNKLGPIETFKGLHDVAKPKFVSAWKSYKYSAEEVTKYPQDRCPQSLKDLIKDVKDAYDPIATDLAARKYVEAEAGIAALKQAVDLGHPAKRKHDQEMRKYYAGLKKLRPSIANAETVVATPELNLKFNAFTRYKAEMIQAQNDRDYELANRKAALLEGAIETLFEARRAPLLQAIDDTDDPAVAGDNIKKLFPEDIVALGAKKQAQYLKKLRTNTDGTPIDPLTGELRKARNHLYTHIQLDPQFVKEDQKNRDKLIQVFQKDKKFQKARDNWGGMSNEKKKEFLVYAVKQQCKILGHPEPKIKLMSTRQCGNDALPCPEYGEDQDASRLPPCPTCGSNKTEFDFGACDNTGSDSTIEINTIDEANFQDFGEQFDSIMHENAHAYQMYLAYDLMNKTPPKLKETDPRYDQAMLFFENEIGAGYVQPGKGPYDEQPLERHAWVFGPAMRDGLLGPKVVQKLDDGVLGDDTTDLA